MGVAIWDHFFALKAYCKFNLDTSPDHSTVKPYQGFRNRKQHVSYRISTSKYWKGSVCFSWPWEVNERFARCVTRYEICHSVISCGWTYRNATTTAYSNDTKAFIWVSPRDILPDVMRMISKTYSVTSINIVSDSLCLKPLKLIHNLRGYVIISWHYRYNTQSVCTHQNT